MSESAPDGSKAKFANCDQWLNLLDMGCLASKPVSDDVKASQNIDLQLKNDHDVHRKEIKLLLLGAGESGKSTIRQQFKLIEGIAITDDEREQFADVCRTNGISSLQIILDHMILLGISLADKALKPSANLILELRPQAGSIGIQSDGSLMPGILDAVVTLWKDAGVQECFQRNNEYQLNDSAEYFLENASRIYKEGWLPTDTDVLKARVKTTGISETRFQQQGRQFIVVDVGGQRSERRKWLHCFDNVTALLYVVALNEWNMFLREDESINRMREAHILYSSIVTSPHFINVPVILFLNKADLLRRKCQSGVPAQMINHPDSFPEFTGDPTDWKAVFRFIESKFTRAHQGSEVTEEKIRRKKVYSHMCTATDTDNMKIVLASVADIVLRNNLEEAFGRPM